MSISWLPFLIAACVAAAVWITVVVKLLMSLAEKNRQITKLENERIWDKLEREKNEERPPTDAFRAGEP
jgi:hypothetical protein